MSLALEQNNREDVGDILVKVQEDLNRLKVQVLDGGAADVDANVLQQAISKTEESIKAKSEQWVQHVNNQVLLIPSARAPESKPQKQQAAVETTWDLRTNTRGAVQLRRTGPETYGLLEPSHPANNRAFSMNRAESVPNVHTLQMLKARQDRKVYPVRRQSSGNEPVQLPIIKNKQPQLKMVVPCPSDSTPLPNMAEEENPSILAASITEQEARQGLMSLVERGVIPPSAEITLRPSPVQNKAVALHKPDVRQQRISHVKDPTAGLKLDPSLAVKRKAPRSAKKRHLPAGRHDKTNSGVGALEPSTAQQPLLETVGGTLKKPPPTTPASSDSRTSTFRFAVHHGKVRETSSDFVAFQNHYQRDWERILNFLQHLEIMCTDFAVPIAFINGDKLADVALVYEEDDSVPSVEELLAVVINRDDVVHLIKRPGRRLLGPDGGDVAAVRIQAVWRGYRQRRAYQHYQRQKVAVGIISKAWRTYSKLAQIRRQIKGKQLRQLENFRQKQMTLASNWSRISTSRRLVVHIPSLGYPRSVRQTFPDLAIRQNAQMTRLCDLIDNDVDVVYVSPVPLEDDTRQYCAKLLGLRGAVDTADAKQTSDLSSRYTLIVPEAITIFSNHNMCLSTLLKYSPLALRRLSNLVRGREAYILPGLMHVDDLYLSEYLGLPVLGPEPELAQLYSSKSGSKRVFASAEVETPPSMHDVYTLQQLQEGLAALVTENLLVAKWLLKLDHECDGRGTAVCDVVRNLSCYTWARKEAKRYGDKWSKPWAREAAYHKIYAEIPKILDQCTIPVCEKRFPSWSNFLEAFLREGGVVEAYPPSSSVTTLSAEMLIEPHGSGRLLTTGDQLHADSPLRCWGHSVPQSSVESENLNEVCDRIMEACRQRHIFGHISVDFATFIHPETEQQELWAIDLSLYHSDALCMSKLMDYVTCGSFDTQTHAYSVPPLKLKPTKKNGAKAKKSPKMKKPQPRFAVGSTRLLHSDLALLHYSTFFQMCRSHGVGYDVKERLGTVFSLNDYSQKEHLGMLTIFNTLESSLENFARNLSVVDQEISIPNGGAATNFKTAVQDIENILGTTVVNAESEKKVAEQDSVQLMITEGR